MGILSNIEPTSVMYWFEEISRIPRESGNTAQAASFVMEFAGKKGLKASLDKGGNVTVFAPGTEGMESAEPVILQGHLDMVCVKTPESAHNFETDPLELVTDGDSVYAEGTSLGGDDGIAVAMMMAVMDDPSIPHPPLECIFTSDEETGLLGASAYDASILKGRRMINLDSEEEGILTCGCAGGARIDAFFETGRGRIRGLPVRVTIGGLLGGHSGGEIHTCRANACKLAGRFLHTLSGICDYSLEGVSGGERDNVIPGEARVQIVIEEEDFPKVSKAADSFRREISGEWLGIERGITVAVEKGDVRRLEVLDPDSQDKIISFLMHVPYGVRKMSGVREGLVETSSNLGVVRTGKQEFACTVSVRSSSASGLEALCEEIEDLAALLGAKTRRHGEYPGWEYRASSPLRDVMTEVFREQYGREMKVNVIHAGLECGLFSGKIRDLDAVSIGPDIEAIHSVNEKLSVASVQRVWKYLLAVLAKLG